MTENAATAPFEPLSESEGDTPSNPVESAGDALLGRIVTISGTQIIAILNEEVCAVDGPYELHKGELVKMICQKGYIFGIVSGLTIPVPENSGQNELLLAEIEMVGEITSASGGVFRRGVSEPPSLNEPIYPTTEEDLSKVYNFEDRSVIEIGQIHQNSDRPAICSVDGMLGKHFALLGSTGSGKSCGVSLLLRRLSEAHPNGHIVLLDLHGEYGAAFEDIAEILTPSTMDLPYWLFNSEEICEAISLGRREGEHIEEALLLFKDLIVQARKSFLKTMTSIDVPENYVTADTPIPYAMREILKLIDEEAGKLDKSQSLASYRWLKARIESMRADARFSFIFGGLSVRDNMAEILARLFRIPCDGKPLTIVDISGLPSEVINVVVSVLCRMIFDFAFWSRGMEPILLVCEEAHRYAPATRRSGEFSSGPNILSRIAKEGRKYGISLAVVSQRPVEVDPTILSQCNTTFAFRMTNERDQDIVKGTMSETAYGLLDFLPSLGTGECIISGEAVPVPQRVVMDILPDHLRPRSSTAAFSDSWSAQKVESSAIPEVVHRWRRQAR